MKSMLYIVWGDANNLGIPIIDEQHRGIVSAINTLHFFIQSGRGANALKPTLSILEQYTRLHFTTEEALMKEVGYSDIISHASLHGKLREQTAEFSLDSELSKSPDKLLAFLKEWWLNHINVEDRKYVPFVKDKLGIK